MGSRTAARRARAAGASSRGGGGSGMAGCTPHGRHCVAPQLPLVLGRRPTARMRMNSLRPRLPERPRDEPRPVGWLSPARATNAELLFLLSRLRYVRASGGFVGGVLCALQRRAAPLLRQAATQTCPRSRAPPRHASSPRTGPRGFLGGRGTAVGAPSAAAGPSPQQEPTMSGKGAKGLSGKGAKGTLGGVKGGDKKKPISRSARAGEAGMAPARWCPAASIARRPVTA